MSRQPLTAAQIKLEARMDTDGPGDHCALTVAPAYTGTGIRDGDEWPYDYASTLMLERGYASVLARFALRMAPTVRRWRHEHGCERGEGCELVVTPGVIAPEQAWADEVYVVAYAPRAKRRDLTRDARGVLADLTTGDAWEPAQDDEERFAGRLAAAVRSARTTVEAVSL